MNKEPLRYGGYILIILGLIGIISQTAPVWSRYTVLVLGIILFFITIPRQNKV
jgi:hypothetical protein